MSRKTKKIFAGIAGFGLIAALLFFVNSFLGNPVSNAWAEKAAQQYIDETYSGMGLQIQRCAYNFKSGSYTAFAQSQTSVDTAFGIHVDSFGNIVQDDYEYEVANNFTTFRRLDEELRAIAQEVLGGSLPYEVESVFLMFTKEADLMVLTRDMALDIHKPPLPLQVSVTLFSSDISYTKIAEAAKAVESILQKQDIPVVEYNICIQPSGDKPAQEDQFSSWENALSVSDFPSERLSEENLPQVMEQYETERVIAVNKASEK